MKIELQNIYSVDQGFTGLSLYTYDKYAIRINFSNPCFNDYNEIRFSKIAIFEFDKDELDNVINSEVKTEDIDCNILLDKSIINEMIERLEASDKDVSSYDMEMNITPYIENITFHTYDENPNSLEETALVNYFNKHFKDSFYKDGNYPEFIKK